MDQNQRTQDVYEQIPAYPIPPRIAMPDLEDPNAYRTLAGTLTPTSLRLSRFLVRAIGLKRNFAEFTDKIEQVQRTTNLRLPGLYAPVISASISLNDDERITDAFLRAATLLMGARSLCDSIFSGTLPADTLHGQALEMGQYPNLFGVNLVIENQQTRMVKSFSFDRITILLNKRLYQLQVGHLGVETSVEQVARALREMAETQAQAEPGDQALAPGILTNASDGTQLRAFSQMENSPQNRQSFHALKDSLLTLCLDLDQHPEDAAQAARLAQVGNPENRWHHASLQIVVFGNAKACLICNYTCYLDGNVMMRAAAEMQRRSAAWPIHPNAIPQAEPIAAPVSLPLTVKPEHYEMAWQDFKAILDEQPATFVIQEFGQNNCNLPGINAVGLFILGLALAGRKLTGNTPVVNQFLTMSRYRCMDMFPAAISTPELRACVDYLSSDQIDPEQARTHIRQAIASQQEVSRQVRNQLSLLEITNLYLLSMRKGPRRLTSLILYSLMMNFFKSQGYFKAIRRDVLVSFPEKYPETYLLGRPGVRLPYVRQYGLHYQIFDDKTILTCMPALTWQIPNQDLVAAITQSLCQLTELLEMSKRS